MQKTSRRGVRLLAFIAISVLVLSVGVANAATPTITSLSPAQGPIKGGNSVVINGSSFTGATSVMFGATPATSFTVNSASKITAIAPARPIGMVDVRVTTPEGTSAVGASSDYTYVGPSVTSMSPTSSAPAGGVRVVITGSRFTGASAVKFGVTSATFTVNSSTQITATAPARPPGTIDVRVTTAEGTSRTSAGSKFTYLGPIIDAITPAQGPMIGGTTVTITGSGLNGATAVKFGATAATSFTVNSATQITAVAPPRPVGTIDVRVTTPMGTSGVGLNTKYAYLGPSVTKISPTTGPKAGGTRVTITGTRLNGATAVLFGPTAASSFTIVNSTTVTAIAPARPVGGVHVRVQTPEGISRTTAADMYTYQ